MRLIFSTTFWVTRRCARSIKHTTMVRWTGFRCQECSLTNTFVLAIGSAVSSSLWTFQNSRRQTWSRRFFNPRTFLFAAHVPSRGRSGVRWRKEFSASLRSQPDARINLSSPQKVALCSLVVWVGVLCVVCECRLWCVVRVSVVVWLLLL